MKSINTIIAALGFLSSSLASASLVDFEFGTVFWDANNKLKADVNDNWAIGHHKFDSSLSISSWFDIAHEVPFVPNVKLRGTWYSEKEDGIKASLSNYDVLGYYRLIELTPVTLDLGGGVKTGDMKYKYQNTERDFDDVIPELYGRAKFDFPGTGLGFGAELLLSKYPNNETTMYDANVSASWMFGETILSSGIDVGWRYFYLEQEVKGSSKAQIKNQGPYIGVKLGF